MGDLASITTYGTFSVKDANSLKGDEETSEKTRLVGNERSTRYRQTNAPPGGNDGTVMSARQKPIIPPKPQIPVKNPIVVKPTGVREVDKRLEDHAQLYNEHLGKRNKLFSLVQELQTMFSKDGRRLNLQETFAEVKRFIHESNAISVERRFQYCMEIQYDGKDLHHKVIPAFMAFNKANKLVKDIIDKSPTLVASVLLVVDNEKELRRDVLVASLGPEGPNALKNCMESVSQLAQVHTLVDDIKAEAISVFNNLMSGVQVLVHNEQPA